MSLVLKQSTATDIHLGPFISNTDFKTVNSTLGLTQSDVRLSKNGATFAQLSSVLALTHSENGHFKIPLSSTDTNTLGRLRIVINKSGTLQVWQDYMVWPANTFDSLISTSDKLQVHTDEITNNLITSASLSNSSLQAIADGLLDRDMSVGTDSGSTTIRTPRQALRFLRNRWTLISDTLSVKKEDDSTESWSASVGTTTTADFITSLDPSGP